MVYQYSKELRKPFSTGNMNFEGFFGKIAVNMFDFVIRRVTRCYHGKNGIRVHHKHYRSFDKATVDFFLIEPENCNEPLPVIIYYHGGAFMFPIQPAMLKNGMFYAKQLHCKVIMPEYRLTPKHSCKTTIEDCYSMLTYVHTAADKMNIDTNNILVYGESAGGALAAGITLLSRDRKGPSIKGQMLIYPVTDYQSDKYPSMEQYKDSVWSDKSNRQMWNMYLRQGDFGMLDYAAPLHHHQDGLPPTYIEPQEMDSLRDEAIAYAKKIEESGGAVELNVIPGSYHGFDLDHNSPLVKRTLAHRCKVMKQILQLT